MAAVCRGQRSAAEMKRKPKVHLMREHDRNAARCGAVVIQRRLTDQWQRITCNECLPAGQRARVGEYVEAHAPQ